MNTLRKIFFYSPENAGKKRTLFRNLHWAVNILALLLWSWGLGLLSLYFAAAGKVYTIPLCISYVRKPLILLLNILPVLMMTLFLWFDQQGVDSGHRLGGARPAFNLGKLF